VKIGTTFHSRPLLRATAFSIWLLLCCCAKTVVWDGNDGSNPPAEELHRLATLVEDGLTRAAPPPDRLRITSPYDRTLFPADIAAPTITWIDGQEQSRWWLLSLTFSEELKPLYVLTRRNSWTPEPKLWETIKARSRDRDFTLAIHGLADRNTGIALSRQAITLRTSSDAVGDSIFYRQIPLPFAVASQSFEKTRWRLGSIASDHAPATVMEGISTCASCHAFSADGKKISMEYNYNNDNGAHFQTEIRPEIVVDQGEIFTWSSYPRSGLIPPTRGLFGRMSPSGRFAAASINEISFATVMDDLAYSQLFFPTYGIIAIYDGKRITPLAGASDDRYVQANPTWSADEKFLYFCRAKSKNEVHPNLAKVTTIFEKRSIEELNQIYNIQFDLYRLPFNEGRGGEAEPVRGASQNGMSNYFPRVSPDGKWLIMAAPRATLSICSRLASIIRRAFIGLTFPTVVLSAR